MPFDDEPRNGDFAAYVDRLLSRQTPPSQGDAHGYDGRDGRDDSSARPSRGGEVIRRDHDSRTESRYGPEAAEREGAHAMKRGLLGPGGSPRLLGLVQIVLGMGTLVLLINAIERARYSVDVFALANLVPIGVLAVIAGLFLLRGRAKLHEAQARKAAERAGAPAPSPRHRSR